MSGIMPGHLQSSHVWQQGNSRSARAGRLSRHRLFQHAWPSSAGQRQAGWIDQVSCREFIGRRHRRPRHLPHGIVRRTSSNWPFTACSMTASARSAQERARRRLLLRTPASRSVFAGFFARLLRAFFFLRGGGGPERSTFGLSAAQISAANAGCGNAISNDAGVD